jgi:hypothetical protein
MRAVAATSAGEPPVTIPQMPHTMAKRYAVVSCHVERPLDDAVWERFAKLQARRPAGFQIAALMRPPDAAAGEDARTGEWLARARLAAQQGPFGLHTHWTAPDHARPTGHAEPAERVRAELAWLREHGLDPRLFCGGGWYMDERVAAVLADAGLTDCTATAFRPSYLAADAPRLGLDAPTTLETSAGPLAEVPSTHSIGLLLRALPRPLAAPVVHVYFHDTDLLDRRRAAALELGLRLLRLRRRPSRPDVLPGPETTPLPYS